MMKNSIHLFICFLLLTTVGFLTSCQPYRNEKASAEEVTARYGEGEDPEAVVDPAAEGEATAGQLEADAPPGTQPRKTGGNRFGFAGAGTEGPVKPLRRDNQTHKPEEAEKKIEKKPENAVADVREEVVQAPPTRAPRTMENKIEAPTPPPAPPAPEPPVTPPASSPSSPQIVNLGFAEAIPGDNLHVKLPGEFSGLPAISVEKMDVAGNNLGVSYPRGTLMKIPNPKVPGGQIHFKVP